MYPMTRISLIPTQIVPPRIKNHFKRLRLLNLGFSILSYRVTTVVAPAGYGKSVWISSLLSEPGWPPTAWLNLDHHDSEPSAFLFHLVNAVKHIFPEFVHDTLRTLHSLEDVGQDWLIALSAFLTEIPQGHPMVLVLDDLHLIDKNPTIQNILEYLVRWLPSEAHLVFISRNGLPLNLYREQLSGELLEITSNNLLFSLDETRGLLSLLGLNLKQEDLDEVHTLTEGWAVGLRLMGIHLKRTEINLNTTLFALNQTHSELYNYLSNELLDTLPPELQSFLISSSLLPYLEPNLCDASIKCKDSHSKIKQLHSLGILSMMSETKTRKAWRLHHLMAEFLEKKVLHLRSADYVIGVRQRAATFLENNGDIDRALEQITACADWTSAIRLIHVHGDHYFLQNGHLDALGSWIAHLPYELVLQDSWLLYFQGMSILHINSLKALETLSQAADTAGINGDIKCQLRSLLAMVAVYTFANNVTKIRETAKRLPIAGSLLKSSWSRGTVLVAALSKAAFEDNLSQGVWLSWLASKAELDSESRMAHMMFTTMIHYRLGNLNSASELVEKLLTDPYVQENERWTGTTYTIYAVLCVLTGELQKLVQICTELLRLGQKYNVPHQLGIAYRRLALLHMWEARLDEALLEIELSHSAFMRANNLFYAYLTDLDLILLRIKAGESAKDLILETQNLLEKLKVLPGGQGLDDYALSVAGIIAMEAGQLELAKRQFTEVSLRCKYKGTRQVLAGTRFFLARIAVLQGDDSTADRILRKALRTAEIEKWEFFWDWDGETMYSLCQRALFKKIHSEWAAHLLLRWFPERLIREANTLLGSSDNTVRTHITQLIQDSVRETGLPIIHVNFLGKFSLFVNGVEIPSIQWKTKKSENLFKFLILNQPQQLKETIIEALWPESDPKSGDASLRMALTHVRKALELITAANESVILKRGMVYLNPEITIYTDYERFTAMAQNALEDRDIDNPIILANLEHTAELYQGDLLPDNIYDDWAVDMRTQLRNLYLQVLAKQVETYRRQGKFTPAIQACRQYLALEPTDEATARTTMDLLWQRGHKQQALSLYHELASILAQDFESTPTEQTNALYRKILRS
ncbi:ATP-dependent transcriptional regulator [Desulfosporosinus orientis DSM 765]|uniref:ATP-dependent transcriptional regulator n=2 Tax=Desulfosporosinus orientis TaxID=1563 RepID=G7W7R1_DESOD|nr:ATP-dependent transcriptional regulator [Desulfosporosinus orientis DSM 765]